MSSLIVHQVFEVLVVEDLSLSECCDRVHELFQCRFRRFLRREHYGLFRRTFPTCVNMNRIEESLRSRLKIPFAFQRSKRLL